MNALIKYDAACRALAEAKAVDEAKDIHDKAEAMRVYARQAKNRDLEIDAAEIRMRAERRVGQLIQAQKETVGLNKGTLRRGAQKEPRDKRPTLAEVGIDKKMSSRAQRVAAVPEEEFEDMVAEWRGRIVRENERVTVNLLRERERARRDEALGNVETIWPKGRYPVIYADPPWRYEHAPPGGENRLIENHYPTMTLEEICALPVQSITHDDAILFLWATAPQLANALKVVEAWSFEYRTCMMWVKDKIGMGYYVRQRGELLLIARRGEMRTPAPADRPDSVVEAPRLEHSAKPGAFYGLIEQMYPRMPKIELFARNQRDGWAVWGNQAQGGRAG